MRNLQESMRAKWPKVALWLAGGALAGLWVYRIQPANIETMNAWGIVAFASLGGCLGCLLESPRGR